MKTTDNDAERASLVAAIDLGTSTIKCVAAAVADPRELDTVWSTPTPLVARGELCEFDVRGLAAAVDAARDALLAHVSAAGAELVAVGVTGQIGGALPLARDGRLLQPALCWQDNRAEAQAEAYHDHFDDRFEGELGHWLPPHTCWSAGRLRWLVECAPETTAEAVAVLQPPDYVVHRLTGRIATAPTAQLGLVHQARREWSVRLTEWTGWPLDKLPALQWAEAPTMATPSGPVRVVPAGGDTACGFIGMNLRPGEAGIQAGTTEIAGVCLSAAAGPLEPSAVICLPYDDHQIAYGSTNQGGLTLTWLARLLGIADVDSLEAEAAALAPDDIPCFVPHLGGARAPYWDTAATAAFLGLQPWHGPAHLYRSVLTACALGKRQVLAAILGEDLSDISSLRLAGGGARCELANVIRAGVLGLPLQVTGAVDVAALGACAAALGPDGRGWLDAYYRRQPSRTIAPDPVWQRLYRTMTTRWSQER